MNLLNTLSLSVLIDTIYQLDNPIFLDTLYCYILLIALTPYFLKIVPILRPISTK